MARKSWTTELDGELLEASRLGDNGAYAVLWERHHRAGLTAARNIAPRLDPADLVSESYLRILELVQDGRGPNGAFRPYLYRVIRTIAADTYRPNEDTSDSLEDIPNFTGAGPWEDGAFDRNSAAKAFAGLNERWQSVLWYTVVEGLPPREAAKLLGMSANAVSALAIRAREALQSGWVEAHVDLALADAACRFTLENLQRHQRGKVTAAVKREIDQHLDECKSCPKAAAEFSTLNRQLALVLASLFVGGGTATALLGGFGQAVPAVAATGGGAGTASGAGAGGSAASASSGPAALIAGATIAAVAVLAGGAIVVSNALGVGGSSPTASGPSSTDTQTAPEPTPGQRTSTPSVSASPTSEPKAEKSEVVSSETPAVPGLAPEPVQAPEPGSAPEPAPTENSDGITEPTVPVSPTSPPADRVLPPPAPTPPPVSARPPAPEPVIDPQLLKSSRVCLSPSNSSYDYLFVAASRHSDIQLRLLPGTTEAIDLDTSAFSSRGHSEKFWRADLDAWSDLNDRTGLSDGSTSLQVLLTSEDGTQRTEWTTVPVVCD